MPQPLPRVVELVRVSTDAQKEKATHEVQRQALDRLNASRPGIIVRRLEALGVSGAKGVADRIDLQDLRRLSQAKAFDELRVFSVDRLTRSDDPRERAAIYGMVLDAEAKIVDCNGRVIDPAKDGDLGELDYFLQTLFSARERKKIVTRTAAGRKLKASQGKASHGLPPYGRRFDRTAQAWELVPAEVEVYRSIIDACLEGKTILEITRDLNARRIPSRRGRWGTTSVQRLLTTPSICGEYSTHGFTIQIPPVCDRETWGRVKATLKQRVSRPPDTKAIGALLRGLGTCAACGLPLWVLTSGANKGHARYGCPKPSKRDLPCPDRRTMTVAEADGLVRDGLVRFVREHAAFNSAVLQANGHTFTPEKTAKALDAEIVKLEAKEAKTLRLYTEGFLTESLAKTELGALRLALEAAKAKRESAPASKPLPLREIESTRRHLAAALERVTDARVLELVAILQPTVRLGASGLDVSGNFPARIEAAGVRYENLAAWKSDSVPERVPFSFTLAVKVPALQEWWASQRAPPRP